MAVQVLHKALEELVLDTVCRDGKVTLGSLGEKLKGMLGHSPKSILDLELGFMGNDSPSHNHPRSLLYFVKNVPFLSVFGKTVATTNSDIGNNACLAWENIDEFGVADYRKAVLHQICHILIEPRSPRRINPNKKGPGGNTILHLVAALPSNNAFYDLYNEQYLTMLLKNGADPREKNDEHLTPLHIVAGRRKLYGGDIKPGAWRSNSRYKQLRVLTNVGVYSKAEFVSCIKVCGRKGNNILHEWVIASLSNEDIHDELWVGALIFSFDGLSDNSNDMGCTPFHYAYNVELFKFFALNGGIHERCNDDGNTPFLSFINKYIDREQFLQGLNGPNGDGKSPIMDIMPMVFSQNHNLLARDCKGNHAIDVLLGSVKRGCYQPGQLISVCRTLESLINYSSSEDLNGENKAPSTPLEAVFDCIESMSNPVLHSVDEDVSPLLDVMNALLEKGVNPNVMRGPNEETLLHKCCCSESLPPSIACKLIGILRIHGADPDLFNRQWETPRGILQQRPDKVHFSLLITLLGTKPKTTVRVDIKSKIHKKVLQKLCVSSPRKVDCYRYDPAVPIGEGAMGIVFPAIDEKGKREVALKRIQKDYKQKGVSTEIETLCKLTKYEQVVDYYAIIDSEPDFHFIVLELMEGDLADLIQHQVQELSENSTMSKLIGDMVKGLKYLHSQPILHRDLKPGNVLYTGIPRLRLKITDFNLAKDLTGFSSRTTMSGHSLTGTRGWMAPELVSRTQSSHTEKSDIFSLGLVCHFLMSRGKHPFDPRRTVLTKQAVSGQTVLPHELEQSIINDTSHMDETELTPAGHHLLRQILTKESQDRPNAALICGHCFFWSIHKKIQFLMAVGDQEEIARPRLHSNDRVILGLEATPLGRRLKQVPWDAAIPDLYNEMCASGRRRYTTTSLAELVRFFRNTYAHEEEQSPTRKAELMANIFFKKFPHLLLTVWGTVLQAGWDKPPNTGDRQRIERALSME